MAFIGFAAFPQGESGGLIEGQGWAYLASAPEGWVWDDSSLRRQGIEGLFYKKGVVFNPTILHMYISPTVKKTGGPPSLGDFIAADRESYMNAEPGMTVLDLAPYSPGMGYSYVLRDFDDSNEGFYQSVAYYEGEQAYFVFVLFCRSVEERKQERDAFLELLDSFTYIRKE